MEAELLTSVARFVTSSILDAAGQGWEREGSFAVRSKEVSGCKKTRRGAHAAEQAALSRSAPPAREQKALGCGHPCPMQ